MNLSSNLKDYLAKSKSSAPNERGSNEEQKGLMSWWSSSSNSENGSTEDVSFDDASTGWFKQAQKDPCLPSLSKKQRIIGFVGCLLMGTFCFSLASLYIPFLVLKARKFALLYTLGSLFVISSFALLWGPMNHVKHLFSADRLPFTVAYFGTMTATLYFSLWSKSTILTVVFAVAQILALLWYVVSYIPGGNRSLSFFTRIFYAAASKTASKTLPV